MAAADPQLEVSNTTHMNPANDEAHAGSELHSYKHAELLLEIVGMG